MRKHVDAIRYGAVLFGAAALLAMLPSQAKPQDTMGDVAISGKPGQLVKQGFVCLGPEEITAAALAAAKEDDFIETVGELMHDARCGIVTDGIILTKPLFNKKFRAHTGKLFEVWLGKSPNTGPNGEEMTGYSIVYPE